MDVKNSPAGHVTEKCAIRQMSFTTDDSNDYYELVHLPPPTEQTKPTSTFWGRNQAEEAAAAADIPVLVVNVLSWSCGFIRQLRQGLKTELQLSRLATVIAYGKKP